MAHTLNIPTGKSKRTIAHSETESNTNPTLIRVFFTKLKARKQAKNIVKALKEVKDFESGKKQPKSFEDFLKEL